MILEVCLGLGRGVASRCCSRTGIWRGQPCFGCCSCGVGGAVLQNANPPIVIRTDRHIGDCCKD